MDSEPGVSARGEGRGGSAARTWTVPTTRSVGGEAGPSGVPGAGVDHVGMQVYLTRQVRLCVLNVRIVVSSDTRTTTGYGARRPRRGTPGRAAGGADPGKGGRGLWQRRLSVPALRRGPVRGPADGDRRGAA